MGDCVVELADGSSLHLVEGGDPLVGCETGRQQVTDREGDDGDEWGRGNSKNETSVRD